MAQPHHSAEPGNITDNCNFIVIHVCTGCVYPWPHLHLISGSSVLCVSRKYGSKNIW